MFTRTYSTAAGGLAVCFLLVATPLMAGHKHGSSVPVVGHYEGFIVLDDTTDPSFLETLTFSLLKDGTAVIVTDEVLDDPTTSNATPPREHETAALGRWMREGRDRVRIGATQFRAGNRLCPLVTTDEENRCALRLTFSMIIDRGGNVEGKLRVYPENWHTGEVADLGVDFPLYGVSRTNLGRDFDYPPYR